MGFSKTDVVDLSEALKEPGWLRDRRLAAWDVFEKMSLPAEKEEPWRYTNLLQLKFDLDQFAPSPLRDNPGFAYPQIELIRQEGKRAGYLIQSNSDIVVKQKDQALDQDGVVFTDLQTAIEQHADLVESHLFSRLDHSGHIFDALHAALFCGGTFVYVPRGKVVAAPLESQRWIDQPAAAVFPHTLIVAEEGSQVTHFERCRSTELADPSLSIGAVEIVAGARSIVNTVTLQEYGHNIWHFQNQQAQALKEATLNSLVVGLGGRFSRQEAASVIAGQGASVQMLGLYFAAGGQHFDFRTMQDHASDHATSDLLYKGALRDDAHTVYSGMIHVRPNGQETDAYQTNRNLVLSDHAKADSKPELQIENNDVRCSHAASVGQINEEELFYLVSRGIPRDQAKRLIVKGFFEEVVARIKQAELQEVLTDAIEKKIAQ